MGPVRYAHTHTGSYPAAFRELPEVFIDHTEKVVINLTKGFKACQFVCVWLVYPCMTPEYLHAIAGCRQLSTLTPAFTDGMCACALM